VVEGEREYAYGHFSNSAYGDCSHFRLRIGIGSVLGHSCSEFACCEQARFATRDPDSCFVKRFNGLYNGWLNRRAA
jgi:hypothetical protein